MIRNAIDTNRSRRKMSQAIPVFLRIAQALAPARDLHSEMPVALSARSLDNSPSELTTLC